ncbi:ATP-binding protein [Pedobacter sp. MC2016-05]|uniref:ATP-binding protein n=1 Tax=Pedobacter sp. MC2016-05 TaxID=2994474 RepID=UPI002245B0F4|nr:tetratricopeptide repeat-containing sensor histidine kinase [Pedobacter sp. MC2016-05]MCX2472711.1 ATP-binding protein [Pedobacter sp. MC2016-05]
MAVPLDADFKHAKSLYEKNNDSAFYYFNRVTTTNKDSLTVAKAYNYMAVIQSDAGDYYGSQESIMRSMSFLKENKSGHLSCISSNYNELGYTSDNLKNYRSAVDYYDKAIHFSTNPAYISTMQNNKALAYQKLGRFAESLKIFNLIRSKETKDYGDYSRLISNIAKTKWLQNPDYVAAPELLKALRIGKQAQDDWCQNLSYSYLTDYYTNKMPDSALYYALSMYQIAQKLNSPDDQLEALNKLIKLSPTVEIKKYFDVYQHLNDSLQTARNAAKNQFAVVRYESEKSKADNLILQKDNTEKRYQIIKRELLLASGFVVFIAVSISAFFWHKKRQQKMELEKESAIRENRLKTSKKVHDVVANGLYRVMSEMENQPEIDREAIIDKIEVLYEKSRDISYDKPDHDLKSFEVKISKILTSFATPQTKVFIAGNSVKLWEKVQPIVRYEIEQVLQELMVNMKKHSKATTVVLKFEQEENQVNIWYTDNGIGMPEDKIFNNGWKNTVSRIDGIGGKLTFETKAEKGLKVRISFPVS